MIGYRELFKELGITWGEGGLYYYLHTKNPKISLTLYKEDKYINIQCKNKYRYNNHKIYITLTLYFNKTEDLRLIIKNINKLLIIYKKASSKFQNKLIIDGGFTNNVDIYLTEYDEFIIKNSLVINSEYMLVL